MTISRKISCKSQFALFERDYNSLEETDNYVRAYSVISHGLNFEIVCENLEEKCYLIELSHFMEDENGVYICLSSIISTKKCLLISGFTLYEAMDVW